MTGRGGARPRGLATFHPASLAAGVLVCGLLAAAAYLRFSRLGFALMEGDQSVILGMALRFVRGGPLPLIGIKSSAGIMMPPLAEYLLAVPLFIRQEAMAAVVFNALLGFLAVVACLWFTTRLAGLRAGLIAALLFAVSPWAVHYSRFFWNQNFVPPFSTLLLGSLLLYFAAPRRHPLLLALSLLWLAAAIQLHLAALALIVTVGLIFLLLVRALSLRHLALGVALAVLLFLPYLWYIRITSLTELRAMLSALGGQSAYLNTAAFLHIRDLITGNGLLESAMAWKGAVWPWYFLAPLEGWLFLACAVYAGLYLLLGGWRGISRREPAPLSAAFAILLLWMVVPGLFYLRHTVYLQNYYFIYTYPAPYVLIGLVVDHALKGLASLLRPRLALWRRGALAAANLLLLGPILAIGLWQFHIAEVRMDLQEAGVLHQRQAQEMDRLSRALRRVTTAHPGCGAIVISGGHAAETSPFGLLRDLSGADVRFVQDGRGLIVPEGCAIYLDTTPGAWLQSRLTGLTELTAEEVRSGNERWRFFLKEAGPSGCCDEGSGPVGEWANGLQLLERQLSGSVAPSGTVELVLIWRASGAPGPQVYHFFNHLVHLPDGRLISQEDGPGVHTPYLREGDRFITRFLIPVPADAPAGSYEIRVGLYSLQSLERVPLTGGGDALPIATLELPAQG